MNTRIVRAFGEIRNALDSVTVGYDEFKDALIVAFAKQAFGIRGGHLLVFGPTGVAKTVTVKGLARVLGSASIAIPYARVSGNPDTMPADFLMRRETTYDESGRPSFHWALQAIETFERCPELILPGLLQFDELDKITPKAQHGLLEAMEEQQVSVPKRGIVPLSFMLVATANTRRFDPTAQPLSRAVQDRFGSVISLGYQGVDEDVQMLEAVTSSLNPTDIALSDFPVEEFLAMRAAIQQEGLLIGVSTELKRRIITAIKLTQTRVPGYTDFTKFVKVPAGPRAQLDLFWEAGVHALLTGTNELAASHCMSVGHRVLRGRVEVTTEAEMDGTSTDVLISRILAEVFDRPF